MLKIYFSKSCQEIIVHESCMYCKVTMQIYLLNDMCKNLYIKIIFRNYNFLEKIVEKKHFQK